MDQISEKKREKKKKLKSKKAEAEEHEEQLKRLQETVSQSCNIVGFCDCNNMLETFEFYANLQMISPAS